MIKEEAEEMRNVTKKNRPAVDRREATVTCLMLILMKRQQVSIKGVLGERNQKKWPSGILARFGHRLSL